MGVNNKTILLVDDDYDYLVQQKTLLESEGFSILISEGQSQVKQFLDKKQFDLAIVDLMMENLDSGFVLCHQIKKMHPETPIILLTAVTSSTGMNFDNITDHEKSWVKADTIFAKPVRPEQLINEIQRLLVNENKN